MTPSRNSIDVRPQRVERTIRGTYNWDTGRRESRVVTEGTGWWEATTDEGLSALATTPEGARSMIERMREARTSR
jgi:hypothetical protein